MSTAAPEAPSYSRSEITCRLMVGLEVHVELATRTKMWTAAPNVAHPEFDGADPNTLLSPVVIGMPGTLPVMNRQALEMSARVGLALGCTIAPFTKWDRKSYYYPDLPKNYQISQYDLPLCEHGAFELPGPDGRPSGKTIGITRAHLEEDAGKLQHEAPGGAPIPHSIVDLNRAGTPLLEIVTEPDFGSADEAVAFCMALRDLCRHLGVTEGVMQKGHMRFEPNINVVITAPDGEVFKTPVVEIKNLNSFRAVHGAITHEFERQVDEWLATGKVMGAGAKSTRGWDDAKLVTTPQREKEDAHDYRYFPDPDLTPVKLDAGYIEELRAALPEPPVARYVRYLDGVGLKPEDARAILDEPGLTQMYEGVVAVGGDAKKAAVTLLNAGAKLANERGVSVADLGASPEQIAGALKLAADGTISAGAVEKVIALACDSDDPADRLAERGGLVQVSDDSALEAWVDEAIANPKLAKAVEDVKAGKAKAVGAIMGAVMKLSKGQANPQVVSKMILGKLGGS
ncbi:MAG: Asp-tRNA(Asn)/Glu-tRNA(Gln) amidotransferase subunit GatB [Planctomycetota bacterium]